MKNLIGILVVVMAVFLNSVELGTPLGGGFGFPLRPGSAPRPVPVPGQSGRRQLGRGGRQERTQSGRTSQPAAAPAAPAAAPRAAAPEAPPPATRSNNIQPMIETTYIKDPQHGYIKLSEAKGLNINVTLLQFHGFFIGRIVGEDILPIFDKDRNIVRIDISQNYLQITMSRTVARRWGVFENYVDFCRAHPVLPRF